MIEFGTIFSGIRTADSLVGKVLSKKGTRIDKKIIAVASLQRAINATEIYLSTSNRNYSPNENLSNQWLEAFTAMIKIDNNLAGRLRDKSRFWSDPQRWMQEDGAMELVPDLIELNEKCESILVELQKRK
ncbi:hypothetical protein SAMN05428642_104184 [Flaviramulus basaltis]|uniref:Uncharacterized protein n=1 Tax=Flaviramulus basaltis TaxID=369401 RepID=A0A1K2IRU8_9FLAO|nr:hypothetical protein [Flaviramulus basaltis]SFZ94443.1 hypothetical protein SAMN05428642_104184 [Flaviramulus basaltis]